jgi:hypothetical protein
MMEEKNIEAQVTLEKENTTEPTATTEAAPQNVLFGSISYADNDAYEQFISNMNISQAIFVLIASANFAQAKGSFNLLESESLSSAIRAIRKTSEAPATDSPEK